MGETNQPAAERSPRISRQEAARRRKKREQLQGICLLLGVILAILTVVILVDFFSLSMELFLEDGDRILVQYGVPYEEPGAEPVFFGGIFGADSDKVEITVEGTVDTSRMGEYTLTYTATYRQGLRVCKATQERIVTVMDTQAPSITFEGEGLVYPGATYMEEGFSAWDNFDGDVTAKVTSAWEGDELIYTVTDSCGNTAKVKRELTYLDKVPEGTKVIYLTFDDGPSRYTEELLGILKKYNIRVTFFVVHTDYAPVLEKIAADGHTIAVHSYSHHIDRIYASEEAFYADLELMQDEIFLYTGQRATQIRFPGGSSNTLSRYNPGIMTRLAADVEEKGYCYYDWNVDSGDAGSATTADQVYENVIKGVEGRSTAIVLQHDLKGYSVAAVERIIQWGLENGYVFLPLVESSPQSHHNIKN